MSATHLSGLLVKPRTLTGAVTLSEKDAGKTIFLNSAGSEFVTTLPLPKSGLSFTFVVKGAPTRWDYIIKANGSSDIIDGQVVSSDLDAASDADFETTGNNTIHLVASAAVVGDKVVMISDGTYWYATGYCSVYTAITFQANSSASSSTSPSASPSASTSGSPSISRSTSSSTSPSASSSLSPSASSSRSPSTSPSVSPSPS
jgi:hypothetical protein